MAEPEKREGTDRKQHPSVDVPAPALDTIATTQAATQASEPAMPARGAPSAVEEAASPEQRQSPPTGTPDTSPTVPTIPEALAEDPSEDQTHEEQSTAVEPKQVADRSTNSGNAHEPADQQSEVPPPALDLVQLVSTLASLEERLGESQRLLARQSDLADKLHTENQRLRAGELRAATLPLVRDLLRLHDDIGKLTAGQEDTQDLDLVKVSLLDALARNGITTFQPELGEQFDPKQHSVAGVLHTEDANLDRTVAEVTRVGVQWEDGQTIRVADVRVYKHTVEAEPNGSTG